MSYCTQNEESCYKICRLLNIAPDKAAYLRNFVDLKTQLNSFLCVQKHNKNPWYSIPNFFVAYDAIVFSLGLSFFASQVVVGYKFIHGVAPNLVNLIVNQSRNILIAV